MGLIFYIVFVIMVVIVTDKDRTLVSEMAFCDLLLCYSIRDDGSLSSVREAARRYFRQPEPKRIRNFMLFTTLL